MSNLTSALKTLRDYDRVLPIVLCKLPPRDYLEAPASSADVRALNSRLDSLGKSDPKLVLLDLYRLLALPDGSIDPENFYEDKLHIPDGLREVSRCADTDFSQLESRIAQSASGITATKREAAYLS
jgi:hypothetical protein